MREDCMVAVTRSPADGGGGPWSVGERAAVFRRTCACASAGKRRARALIRTAAYLDTQRPDQRPRPSISPPSPFPYQQLAISALSSLTLRAQRRPAAMSRPSSRLCPAGRRGGTAQAAAAGA